MNRRKPVNLEITCHRVFRKRRPRQLGKAKFRKEILSTFPLFIAFRPKISTLFLNERVNTSKWIKGNWSTHLSLSNIPRKEVSAAPKRNKPGHETKYPKQLMQEAVPKKEVSSSRMHIRTRIRGLHALNTMSAVHVHSTRLPSVGRSNTEHLT